MNDDLWKLKIQAFLHDPPEKAILLLRGESHAARALTLLRLLGIEEASNTTKDILDKADRVAAATSRIVIEPAQAPKGYHRPRVNFSEQPVLINPLSGDQYNLRSEGPLVRTGATPQNLNWDGDDQVLLGAKGAVEAKLGELKSRYGEDTKKLFFALWRCLPEMLRRHDSTGNAALGHLWSLLPADTRVPDHSIWDHLNMTSALAAALPDPVFLLFQIGPVQSFISQARRTQDLWMGSYLLSYITLAAATAIVEDWGPDSILLPSLYGQPLVDHWLIKQMELKEVSMPTAAQLQFASLPNRFLALLPHKHKEAADAAKKAIENLQKSWHEILRAVKAGLEQQLKEAIGDDIWEKLWKEQPENFFETYWVIYPWPDKPDDAWNRYKDVLNLDTDRDPFSKVLEAYKKADPECRYVNTGTAYQLHYDLTERALGARKTVRNFSHQEEKGYKCTLCGEREALQTSREAAGDGETHRHQIQEFWKGLAQKFPGQFKNGGTEWLCAVCASKRLAWRFYFKQRFKDDGVKGDLNRLIPSTSSIAIAPFQAHLLKKLQKDNEVAETFRQFVQKLGDLKEKLGIDWDVYSVPWSLREGQRLKKDLPEDLGIAVDKFLYSDGDWLFESTYEPEHLKKEFGIAEDKRTIVESLAPEAMKALKALLKAAQAKPSRYLAVVRLDGDNMGKWLSGEFAPPIRKIVHPDIRDSVSNLLSEQVTNLRRPLSPFHHNAISAALRDFSVHVVRRVVEEEHLGVLIYAGGDDLLALVPKEEALPVARRLRILYSGLEDSQGKGVHSSKGYVWLEKDKELLRVMGTEAKASAGVAIVHHTHPLIEAIKLSNDMQVRAKEELNRDSFSVAVSKGAGQREIAGANWCLNSDAKGPDVVESLDKLRGYVADGTLSPKLAYVLKQEGHGLAALQSEERKQRLKWLVRRHVDVKMPPGMSTEEKEKEKDRLIKEISSLISNLSKNLESSLKIKSSEAYWETLRLLRLAIFLAREERS